MDFYCEEGGHQDVRFDFYSDQGRGVIGDVLEVAEAVLDNTVLLPTLVELVMMYAYTTDSFLADKAGNGDVERIFENASRFRNEGCKFLGREVCLASLLSTKPRRQVTSSCQIEVHTHGDSYRTTQYEIVGSGSFYYLDRSWEGYFDKPNMYNVRSSSFEELYEIYKNVMHAWFVHRSVDSYLLP